MDPMRNAPGEQRRTLRTIFSGRLAESADRWFGLEGVWRDHAHK
jgi:hypothetical protein